MHHFAAQAEAELARYEPAVGTMAQTTRWRNGYALSFVLASIGFQADVTMPVFFQPGIGVVLIPTSEL